MSPFNLLILSLKIYPKARNALTWLAFQASGPTTRREKGQGLVEYGLILALVAIVAIAILALFGPAIERVFAIIYCSIKLGAEFDMSQSYLLHDGTCTVIDN